MLAFLNQLFGLPAHPLLVHVPIALLPISALGVVVVAVSRTWRERIGWWVLALSVVSLFFVQLAMTSGESLQDHVGERALVQRHAELADPLRPLALVLVLASGAVMLIDRRRTDAARQTRTLHVAVAVVSVAAAAASVVQLARVGHSGAKAVWHETPTNSRRGGEPRDHD